jgi:hypothetical protein
MEWIHRREEERSSRSTREENIKRYSGALASGEIKIPLSRGPWGGGKKPLPEGESCRGSRLRIEMATAARALASRQPGQPGQPGEPENREFLISKKTPSVH